MDYFIITSLVILSFVYLKIADKFGIIDKPNERSSHKKNTIRGGGIIFFLAVVLFFAFYEFQYPYFVIALSLVAIVSFIDDIYTISSGIRFPVQLVAVLLVLFEVGFFSHSAWLIVVVLFFSTGMLNIYNFMDGINGITGLNSIAVLLSLLYIEYYQISFINIHLLIIVLSSLIIFGFYNFRKKAKCFAGDIGSISIGLFIIFCLLKLVLITNNISYILFLLVYMVDGGLTIIERLLKKQNILKPHRNHLYQLFVDNTSYSHMHVSFFYFFSQSVICVSVIMGLYFFNDSLFVIPLVLISVFFYIYIKKKFSEK